MVQWWDHWLGGFNRPYIGQSGVVVGPLVTATHLEWPKAEGRGSRLQEVNELASDLVAAAIGEVERTLMSYPVAARKSS